MDKYEFSIRQKKPTIIIIILRRTLTVFQLLSTRMLDMVNKFMFHGTDLELIASVKHNGKISIMI